MSESPAEPTQVSVEAEQPQEGAEPKTFDADYVAKLRQENAKYRTEAKANAEAAARLAEIEEANKSEAEKLADKLAAAEVAATQATAEAFREAAVTFGGISPEDAELFLTASDKETLQKQAARLVARTPTTPKPDPSQGAKGDAPKGTGDRFADFAEGFFTR